MNELDARCANHFIPSSANDFIGTHQIDRADGSTLVGAHSLALHLERVVARAKGQGNAPIKVLFNGDPGIGKSYLVLYLQRLLGVSKWSLTKLNGSACKIEKVEELERELRLRGFFDDYRLFWIDEADAIPSVAQTRFLTLMDDLPTGVAMACTSNCRLKEFQNRFQSRFQIHEVAPPTGDDIMNLITRLAPDISTPDALHIANFACGNVRQALLDAQGVLQAMTPLQAAA